MIAATANTATIKKWYEYMRPNKDIRYCDEKPNICSSEYVDAIILYIIVSIMTVIGYIEEGFAFLFLYSLYDVIVTITGLMNPKI